MCSPPCPRCLLERSDRLGSFALRGGGYKSLAMISMAVRSHDHGTLPLRGQIGDVSLSIGPRQPQAQQSNSTSRALRAVGTTSTGASSSPGSQKRPSTWRCSPSSTPQPGQGRGPGRLANLLAGRVIERQFFPLVASELGADLSLERALLVGTLPDVYQNPEHNRDILRSAPARSSCSSARTTDSR
jgi:hypothetical protein